MAGNIAALADHDALDDIETAMRFFLVSAVLLLANISVHALERGDVLQTVNEVRKTCSSKPIAPLILDQTVSTAGKHMQGGANLRAALERAGYRADQSAVIHLGGQIDAAGLSRVLKKNYCDVVADRELTAIGIYVSKRDLWLLFTKPFLVPAAQDAAQVAEDVLRLVNQARAKPRRCGNEHFAATTPLKPNPILARAALAHSRDMAKRGHASHTGSDGSAPGDRATRAGYKWRDIGENVAAGQLTADEVMQGWLDSPHHCANIMAAEFVELGVAFAVNPQAEQGIYWTQMFGRAR